MGYNKTASTVRQEQEYEAKEGTESLKLDSYRLSNFSELCCLIYFFILYILHIISVRHTNVCCHWQEKCLIAVENDA